MLVINVLNEHYFYVKLYKYFTRHFSIKMFRFISLDEKNVKIISAFQN